MAKDVRRFLRGCSDCAISKSPHYLPAGRLHPLPIPKCPWSHLGVDYITDLPPSYFNPCPVERADGREHLGDSVRFLRTFSHSHLNSWNAGSSTPRIPPSACYWTHSLPVHALLPASSDLLATSPSLIYDHHCHGLAGSETIQSQCTPSPDY